MNYKQQKLPVSQLLTMRSSERSSLSLEKLNILLQKCKKQMIIKNTAESFSVGLNSKSKKGENNKMKKVIHSILILLAMLGGVWLAVSLLAAWDNVGTITFLYWTLSAFGALFGTILALLLADELEA